MPSILALHMMAGTEDIGAAITQPIFDGGSRRRHLLRLRGLQTVGILLQRVQRVSNVLKSGQDRAAMLFCGLSIGGVRGAFPMHESANIFLQLLLNDKEQLGEQYVNKTWNNWVNWTIIIVLFALSLILAAQVVAPNLFPSS